MIKSVSFFIPEDAELRRWIADKLFNYPPILVAQARNGFKIFIKTAPSLGRETLCGILTAPKAARSR
jgi:hypothetical protein